MNAPFLRSAGCPYGVKPSDWRQALAVRIDQHAAVLSALIDVLDVMDGDADLEPWLGAPEVQAGPGFWGAERTKEGGQLHWAGGGSSDLEEENEHGGDAPCDASGNTVTKAQALLPPPTILRFERPNR